MFIYILHVYYVTLYIYIYVHYYIYIYIYDVYTYIIICETTNQSFFSKTLQRPFHNGHALMKKQHHPISWAAKRTQYERGFAARGL